MSNRVWLISIILALILINAYPLYQLSTAGGYLFYKNAYDETTYLQYDVSRDLHGISRIGQYLVTIAHEAGISGGWINFLLDILTFIALVAGTRAILGLAGFDREASRLSSLLIAVLPSAFLLSNPVLGSVAKWLLSSGLVYWISMPQANFLPIIRSPEPQVSLVLLTIGLLLCLRLKTFVPIYLILPFLYPFIAVPVAFILLALHLRTRIFRSGWYSAVPPLISFLIVSSAAGFYFDVFTDESMKEALVATRAPLFSLMGFLCLLTCWAVYSRIDERQRYFALLVSLAPFVGANQQVLSGFIAQPCGFEQYFGVFCLPILLALGLKRDRVLVLAATLIGALTLASSTNTFFQFNDSLNRNLILDDELIDRLRSASERVAFTDTESAALAGMILPRQPATLFAYAKTYSTNMIKENFQGYLCAKRALLGRIDTAAAFRRVFATLDPAYQYQNRDFILLHLGRKESFKSENEPDWVPERCPAADYWLYTRPGSIEPLSPKAFRLYSLPEKLRVPFRLLTFVSPPPDSAELLFKTDDVRIEQERWVVRSASAGLLAQSISRQVDHGSYFVAQGEVHRGSLAIGLNEDDRQLNSVVVENQGEFAVVIEVPRKGQYGFTLASSGRDAEASDKFVITRAGWTDPHLGDVYALSADLSARTIQNFSKHELKPLQEDEISYQAENLQREGGRWVAGGSVEGPYLYLLSTRPRQIPKGAYLFAQGELHNGGLTLGLVKDARWAAQVNVVNSGRFTVMIEVDATGLYSSVLANYLPSGSRTNEFVLERLGWVEK